MENMQKSAQIEIQAQIICVIRYICLLSEICQENQVSGVPLNFQGSEPFS